MFHIIIADSELETIPKEMASEKPIREEAKKANKKPTDLLLDSNYHHREMEKIEQNERRGRPDIIHACLLTALDTPLNRENLLRIHIHTRHDKIIEIDPETRIPRSYNRFIGLIEQLFQIGAVPPEDSLLKIHDKTLRQKISEIEPEKIITLSERGERIDRNELLKNISPDQDIAVLIGGFPHNDFKSDVEEFSDEIIKIYSESLDAVTVLNHIIQFFEEDQNLI